MELAARHPSGAWNLQVAPRFLETLVTLAVRYVQTAAKPWSHRAQNTALRDSDGGIMDSVIAYTGMWMKMFHRKTLPPASGSMVV